MKYDEDKEIPYFEDAYKEKIEKVLLEVPILTKENLTIANMIVKTLYGGKDKITKENVDE